MHYGAIIGNLQLVFNHIDNWLSSLLVESEIEMLIIVAITIQGVLWATHCDHLYQNLVTQIGDHWWRNVGQQSHQKDQASLKLWMSYVLWQQSFLPKDKTNSSNSPPPHSLKFRNDHGQAASTWSLSLWAKGLCLTCCWKISDVLCLNVTRKIVLLSMVRNFLVDTSFQFFRSSFLMYVLLYISSVIFVLPKPH